MVFRAWLVANGRPGHSLWKQDELHPRKSEKELVINFLLDFIWGKSSRTRQLFHHGALNQELATVHHQVGAPVGHLTILTNHDCRVGKVDVQVTKHPRGEAVTDEPAKLAGILVRLVAAEGLG